MQAPPTESYYTPASDAESGERWGINPDLWGRHTWDALHYITLGYPETNPSRAMKRSAYDLVVSLQYLLPCGLCRAHLAQILQTTMPLTDEVLSGRRAFGEYIVRLRDYVKTHHVLPAGARWPVHTFDRDVVDRLLGQPSSARRGLRWIWWGSVVVGAAAVALLVAPRLWRRRKGASG